MFLRVEIFEMFQDLGVTQCFLHFYTNDLDSAHTSKRKPPLSIAIVLTEAILKFRDVEKWS